MSLKFSVLLPVRNGGEYVKECVRSILSQSYQDFNLLILDNCSTDGTLEWVRSLQDPRIVVYPSASALSMEENWSRIVTIPKNEFITLIGHDDILHENYLSTMDELIAQQPGASLYQSHFRFIDAGGKLIRTCKPMPATESAMEFMAAILSRSTDTMGTGYMMRSSDYDSLGGMQPYPNLMFADHELWIRLAALHYRATAPGECFSFRIHQSISRTTMIVQYIRAFYRFMDFLISFQGQYANAAPILEKFIPGYIKFHGKSFSNRLIKVPVSQREGMTVDAWLKKCNEYIRILAPGASADPAKTASAPLAAFIDRFAWPRNLYIGFRKLYKKPIYNEPL